MLYAIQSALITSITTMENYICFMHVNKMKLNALKCLWKYELSQIIILRIKCLSKQQLVHFTHCHLPSCLSPLRQQAPTVESWLNPQQHIVMVVVFSD